MPFFEHALGKTFWTCKGKKSNPTIIALNGGPGGQHLGLYPLFDLVDKYRVFLYDQIGAGRSDPIRVDQMKISTFVDELDALIKHWEIDEFILFGSSWGTTLALEYYLRKKGRGVKGIIFQSPMFSAKLWQKDADILLKALPLKTQKVIHYCHEIEATDSKVYQEAVKSYYFKHVYRSKIRPSFLKGLKKNSHGDKVYQTMWGPSEFKASGILKSYDKVSSLKQIKVPTLFLCGRFDEARPDTVEKFHKLVKESSFKVISKSSHAILWENSSAMLKEIRLFLDKRLNLTD